MHDIMKYMISYMISYIYPGRNNIMYDIIHDIMAYMISCMISYLILDMISCLKMHFSYFLCTAAANPRPALRADETDDDNEPGGAMDIDEGRGVDCRGAERHPGEQPGSQPRGQRAASDILLH